MFVYQLIMLFHPQCYNPKLQAIQIALITFYFNTSLQLSQQNHPQPTPHLFPKMPELTKHQPFIQNLTPSIEIF